jgi:hypothetical protein
VCVCVCVCAAGWGAEKSGPLKERKERGGEGGR